MPITIIDPGFGVLTPGAQITGSTSIVGPIPVDDEWWFSLVDSVSERVQLQQRVGTGGSKVFAHQWLDPRAQIIPANSPTVVDQANARLLVELRHANTAIVESASVAIKYDATVGLPTIQQLQTQAQGGLTTEEHQQLMVDLPALLQQVIHAAGGVVLSTPIGSLIAHPDLNLLHISSFCETLTGRGELHGPGGTGYNLTFALLVDAQVIPPGFGLRDGAVVEYRNRLCQFATVHLTDTSSTGLVTEVRDVYIPHSIWMWQTYNPATVLFDVTPGVQVRICYITGVVT